jgi:Short C-terminal domain
MGLLRGIARTAAIAGTATAVSNRVSRRQAGRWAAKDEQAAQEQQAQYAEQQPQYAQPQYAEAPAATTTDDMLEQLQKLGELKTAGVLTDAEFEAQKAKILAR